MARGGAWIAEVAIASCVLCPGHWAVAAATSSPPPPAFSPGSLAFTEERSVVEPSSRIRPTYADIVVFTVSGCGDPRVNGNYVVVAKSGGRPVYQKKTHQYEMIVLLWHKPSGGWIFATYRPLSRSETLYFCKSDAAQFPESGWVPVNATEPVPTLRRMDGQATSRRILIAFASVGVEHESAARAIQEQLRLDMPDAEVLLLDAIGEARVQFENGLEEVVTPPQRFEYLGKELVQKMRSERPWLADSLTDLLGDTAQPSPIWQGLLKLGFRGLVASTILGNMWPFESFVLRHRWDLIISTHFFTALVLGSLRKESAIDLPTITVITDFQPNQLWISNSDHYFVAAEPVEDTLLDAYFVPPAMITVSGIPISPRIRRITEEQGYAAAAESGVALAPRRGGRVVLALPSARRTGLCVAAWQQLLAFARENEGHSVIAVAGRGDGLQEAFLEAEPEPLPENFNLLGFTEQLPELMAISDIVVARPGALVVSEALALGLPFLLIDNWLDSDDGPVVRYLLSKAAATNVQDVQEIPGRLATVFSGANASAEAPIESLRRAARALDRPSAAAAVSEHIQAHFSSERLRGFAGGICCCGRPTGIWRLMGRRAPDCRFFHAPEPQGEPLVAKEHVQLGCSFRWGFNQRLFSHAALCPHSCFEFGDYQRVSSSAPYCSDLRHLWV